MLEFLKDPFFVLYFSYYTLKPSWWCYCNISINADDTTLYSKCEQASDLWQQLEVASKLESDLQDIVNWDRKWFVDFNAGKTELVLFDWSNNTDDIDVKMDGSIFEKKSSCKMLGSTFSSKLDLGLLHYLYY